MKRAVWAGLILAFCATGADLPRRIVSLSPNITELLYGIGAFSQVAGVSDYCTYPPEVTKLPSVGGWHNPSLEKLAALHPDLVLIDDGQAPFVEDNFKALGLRVVTMPDHTVEDVYRSMANLGRVTGHGEEAATLAATMRGALLKVSQRTANRGRPKVLLIVDRTPGTLRDLYAATEGAFLAELVEIAGGRMAAPRSQKGYTKLSKEDLLAFDPDVILDFIHGMKSKFAGEPMGAWREMPELRAVRAGRVYGVDEDFVPHASQRMTQTAELFARLIHPEIQ